MGKNEKIMFAWVKMSLFTGMNDIATCDRRIHLKNEHQGMMNKHI